MKKAFVTGSSGFLGTNLIQELIKEQWEVIVFVMPDDPLTYLNREQITCFRGNILDKETLRMAMPEGESVTVFHVAGMTSMWHKKDKEQYQVNVIGTQNICQIAVEKQVGKLVFTSSISAYGYHHSRVNELTVSNALSCHMNYNKTKYLAEVEVRKAISVGLNAVIVNPCNIIGPYDKAGWATVIVSAYAGNTQGATDGIGTFAHVHDVVKAHIKAAEVGKAGENYLLGGVEVSFKELIIEICEIVGRKVPKRSTPFFLLRIAMVLQGVKSFFEKKPPLLTYPRYKRLTGHIVCDDSKASEQLDYKTCTLKKMLTDSFLWLKKEGVL